MTIESDLPRGTASDEPLDFDNGVAALEGILGDPATEPNESKVQEGAETDKSHKSEGDEPDYEAPNDDESEGGDEEEDADAENPDDDGDEGEESDEDDDKDDDDDSVELTDETEIDLGDGKRATLADLKRDYGQVQKRIADFQRDYTQKTTANAERARVLEEQEARVLNHAQQVAQQRDLVLRYFQSTMPKPPEPPQVSASDDPIAHLEYAEQKTKYDRHMAGVNEFWQQTQTQIKAEQERATAEQNARLQQLVAEQREKLLEFHPELRDPQVAQKTREDMARVFEGEYGFGPGEWSGVSDARVVRAMLDAMAYRKLQAEKPKAIQKVRKGPKLLKGGKTKSRTDVESKKRNAKFERLRKENSLEAAVDALLEFDL